MTTTIDYPFAQTLNQDALNFIATSVESSFAVNKMNINSDKLHIELSEEISEKDFNQTMQRLLFVARNVNKDTIFSTDYPEANEDAFQALMDKEDVQNVAPGMFMFQGEFLNVFNAINSKVKSIALAIEAIEQEHPTLWPVELFKAINYFEEFPHQVILTTGVKPTKQAKTNVAKAYAKNQEFTEIKLDENFEPAQIALPPTVCDCCYYTMKDKQAVENGVYTSYNKVFRNETSKRGGLERLTNFSMREIIFVGSGNYTLEMRQKMFDFLHQFAHELQLSCKLESANDPFFAGNALTKSVFQYASQLKHELLFNVPGLDNPMAVGSVNLHTDFFGKAFNVGLKKGGIAHSTCIGIGLERISYALFCQHGAHIKEWPNFVKEYLEL